MFCCVLFSFSRKGFLSGQKLPSSLTPLYTKSLENYNWGPHPSPCQPSLKYCAETPFQAPSPETCLSPNSVSEKARQELHLHKACNKGLPNGNSSQEKVETTPTGYLNCPLETVHVVSTSLSPLAMLSWCH